MSFLNQLLKPQRSCEITVGSLLHHLNVKFTPSHLQEKLTEHPDYPSLAAISDVLKSTYKVENAALKVQNAAILTQLEIAAPFVAHVGNPEGGHWFAIVTHFFKDGVRLYNPETKTNEFISSDTFDSIFRGTVLIVEAKEDSIENNYERHRRKELRRNIQNHILAFGLPILTLLLCFETLVNNPINIAIGSVIFTVITLAGVILSTLLILYEIDEYNPTLKQICQPGKKINCSAILHSKASKIWGISWSSIGFTYFMGMLTVLLIRGITNFPVLQALSWVNIMATPYIAFSLYYQWKIAKQWCVLCLLVQGILLLQFIIASLFAFHSLMPVNLIPGAIWFSTIIAFGIILTTILILKPSLELSKLGRQKNIELQKLKNSPQIFEALLVKQKSGKKPGSDLGITLGNPSGQFKLIKVCNPYCGPCAEAHSVLEELLENNNEICLQIIFTATNSDVDYKKPTVTHFLGIDAQKDKAVTQKALDDWYSMPIKDHASFIAKYPLHNDSPKAHYEKIERMRQWCEETDIAYTPTLFISLNSYDSNSPVYQLPSIFSIADLKYFLTA